MNEEIKSELNTQGALLQTIRVQREEIDRLRLALEWYADTHHIYLLDNEEKWRQALYTHTFVSQIFLKECETGQRARIALGRQL